MSNQPLAERLRPKTLDDYIGQEHLVGKNAVLRKMIESGNISSHILWGPPGVGKTTLARIIANTLERPFYSLSAINIFSQSETSLSNSKPISSNRLIRSSLSLPFPYNKIRLPQTPHKADPHPCSSCLGHEPVLDPASRPDIR